MSGIQFYRIPGINLFLPIKINFFPKIEPEKIDKKHRIT